MGRMTVEIDDNLDKQFRIAVLERLGVKKGSLAMAIEEAIKLWLKQK